MGMVNRDQRIWLRLCEIVIGVAEQASNQEDARSSSRAAEWYSASAAVCDGLFIRRVQDMLTGSVRSLVLRADNSAVRRAARLGSADCFAYSWTLDVLDASEEVGDKTDTNLIQCG